MRRGRTPATTRIQAGKSWLRSHWRATGRASHPRGHLGNDAVVAEYPPLSSKPFPLASIYDDGPGIRLGASVGAQLRFMEQAFITAPPFYPAAQLVTGILVNKLGKRFVAEHSYDSRTSGFAMDQPDPPDQGGVPDRRLRPHRALCLPSRSASSSTAGRRRWRWSRSRPPARRPGRALSLDYTALQRAPIRLAPSAGSDGMQAWHRRVRRRRSRLRISSHRS